MGAGLGALVGLASGDDKSGLIRFTAWEKAGVLGVSLGVVGTLIGLIAGGGEQWQAVDVSRLSVSFDNPVGCDSGIVVGFRF